MTASSTWRGHKTELVDGVWVFNDNKKPVQDDPNRLCGYCEIEAIPEGHDGCLGTLPGVMNACCGHGEPAEAYVQFSSLHIVSGLAAIDVIDYLKKAREEN